MTERTNDFEQWIKDNPLIVKHTSSLEATKLSVIAHQQVLWDYLNNIAFENTSELRDTLQEYESKNSFLESEVIGYKSKIEDSELMMKILAERNKVLQGEVSYGVMRYTNLQANVNLGIGIERGGSK